MLAQLLVSGVSTGSLYALLALAMVIVYKTSGVLNFGQGEMAMLSTFVAYALLQSAGWPFLYAFIGALVFAALLGAFLDFVFLRRARNPSVLGLIVITLGIEMVLYGVVGWKWGAEQKEFPFPVSDTELIRLGSVVVSHLNLVTVGTATVVMLGLYLFFRHTRLGIAMKATQQNPLGARINGIPTRNVLSFAWALSSVVGATAGMLLAPSATLDPNLMLDPLLKAFASAVLGGMTSLVGAVVGGYALGVVENLVGGYVSLDLRSVVAFVVIVVALCLRPSGLLARHYVRKV